VIGGSIGGVLGGVFLIGLIWYCCTSRREPYPPYQQPIYPTAPTEEAHAEVPTDIPVPHKPGDAMPGWLYAPRGKA
jgi:hypothetical protein